MLKGLIPSRKSPVFKTPSIKPAKIKSRNFLLLNVDFIFFFFIIERNEMKSNRFHSLWIYFPHCCGKNMGFKSAFLEV